VLSFKKILVPLDFSAHSDRALEAATELGRAFGGTLRLLHVYHVPLAYPAFEGALIQPEVSEQIRVAAEKHLNEMAERLRGPKLRVETQVLEGMAADLICQTAEADGFDLIVMGTRGRSGLAHFLLGSVTERTLRAAPCPVLTVKAPEED